MNKWTKIFAAVVTVLVVLVVALIVLANVLITPERVKATLLPLIAENLNRNIELGNIEASLFSGIEIHGLTIYEQEGEDVFVSTDLVRLKYQLLPLLAMKVVVDEVRLDRPTIRIVRLKNGQFNFSDLLAMPDEGASQTKSPANQASSNVQGSAPISLLVSNVLLQDGQLTFFDHLLNDEAPYRYEVSSLQIVAKGVSLTGKVPVSMQCQLNGSLLSLDGHVNLQPLGGDFEIDLQDLDVVAFKPYLQDALPGELGGLKLNLQSALSGTSEKVSLKGTLSLQELDLLLDALPDAPLKNARLDVTYDLTFNPGQERLGLTQLSLDYNGIKVDTRGEVTALLSEPSLDLIVTVPELQIRQAINAVPQTLVGDISSLDPAGSVSLEANVSGGVDEGLGLLKSAAITLESVQATAGGQRPAFSGRLLVTGDQLSSEGLQLRLGDNHADINLTADHLYSTPVSVMADISSERFLLAPLLLGTAGSAVAADQSEARIEGKRPAEEIGPFDIPLHARGTITVAEAVWKGLAIKNFLAQYELKDNILNLARMDGLVAGGSFSNNARVDLGKKGLEYSASLGLKTIQADPILTALMPKAAGNLLGAMDLTFALDGRGTEWQSLSRHLSGHGDMQVADGRLISPGLVNGLSSFLQLPELDDIQFDNFKGQFDIVDGQIQLNSQLISNNLKLFPKGDIGLDGSLDLGLDTRLSPELSARLDKRGSISSYLADKDGWTQMPLLVKGSFSSPNFGLDPEGVKKQASKAVTSELGRQINKLFNRSEPASQQTEQQQTEEVAPDEDPARKMLQDSLQKLFGN